MTVVILVFYNKNKQEGNWLCCFSVYCLFLLGLFVVCFVLIFVLILIFVFLICCGFYGVFCCCCCFGVFFGGWAWGSLFLRQYLEVSWLNKQYY